MGRWDVRAQRWLPSPRCHAPLDVNYSMSAILNARIKPSMEVGNVMTLPSGVEGAVGPTFEVTSPLKVRLTFEMNSRYVAQLGVGTRCRVVETRVVGAGGQRARVVLAGEETPIGWVTARKTRICDPYLRPVTQTTDGPSRRDQERDQDEPHLRKISLGEAQQSQARSMRLMMTRTRQVRGFEARPPTPRSLAPPFLSPPPSRLLLAFYHHNPRHRLTATPPPSPSLVSSTTTTIAATTLSPWPSPVQQP